MWQEYVSTTLKFKHAVSAAQKKASESAKSTSTAKEPSGKSGSAVVKYALQFVGNPYVWGGTSLTGGADCSGFTMRIYEKFGYSLPHSSAAQAGYGRSVSMSSLQPEICCFTNMAAALAMWLCILVGTYCSCSRQEMGYCDSKCILSYSMLCPQNPWLIIYNDQDVKSSISSYN